MRILLLTQFFAPEMPNFRGLPFARELKRRGHSIQVLTGFPNYPKGVLYPGYKLKFYQKETIDGIEVIRVPLYPSHDNSALHRIVNYVSFALSASFIGFFLVKKADAMYVYHPPGSIALPAIILKIFRRIPIIYDIQDLWPDTLRAAGFVNSDIIINIVGFFCNICYKLFDGITVISEGFKNKLIERGVPASKIHIIYNWSGSSNTTNNNLQNHQKKFGFNNEFVILYAGNMGKAQGLESVLQAANKLKTNANIEFVFIGGGVEVDKLKKIAQDLNLENVRFLSSLPPDRINEVLINSDVLLVHLKDDPLFQITIPSKIQAYLMIGKPILIAVKGEAAEIVQKAKAGLACQPENATDIADKVLSFYKMPVKERKAMGKNAESFYKNTLSIEKGTDKFIQVFKKVLR